MSAKSALVLIAGHDPSNGPGGYAGLRADREAALAAARKVTGEGGALALHSIVTAWTKQDDSGVQALGARPPEAWLSDAERAIRQARDEADLLVLKVGLLPGAAHVQALAGLVAGLREGEAGLWVVLDPILRSSSGHTFLGAEGVSALLETLLPNGVVLTPNLPEALALSARGSPPELLDSSDPKSQRLRLGRTLLERGARAILLKGGHGHEDPLLDLLLESGRAPLWLEHPRLPGSMRGTGCRFASALAAALALGQPLADAARLAGKISAAFLSQCSD